MSAIAGLYLLDGRGVDREVPARMIGTMLHRSPDGSAVWTAGPVGFAHGALHTTPESRHEVLPLTNAAGTLTITADARIDNRDELIASLAFPDRPESIADSELILAAYEVWGEACLDRLVGDFAFAIWDEPERKLFCARDHFGIRPFYYHHQPGQLFAFATEIKALLAVPSIPERLNEVRIADFLATMREDAENTIYEDIWRLPAAHALTIDTSGFNLRRYYTLQPAQDVPPDATDAEYESRFHALFSEAVRVRLRSAFPIGSELSGGMDSSSVTCMARELLDKERPLHTFSVVFDDLAVCDERPFIDSVLEHGVPAHGEYVPHYIRGDWLGPLENVGETYTYFDDGLVGGNQHLVWAIHKAAEGAGVRVLLGGLDGDNVVGHGLDYLKELAAGGEWEVFAHESMALAQRLNTAGQRHNFEDDFADLNTPFRRYGLARLQMLADEGPWWQFAKEAQAAHRCFGVRRIDLWRRYWRRLVQPAALLRVREARRQAPEENAAPLLPLLHPDFEARIGMRERLSRFASEKVENAIGKATTREAQRLLLGSSRIQTALELPSHAAAIHNLEVRHPFFDKRLVEFCLALPPRQSLKDGWTRSILRRALRDVLPEAIQRRIGKAWLAPNFERGLYEQDGALLEEHVKDLGPLSPYVDQAFLENLYTKGAQVQDVEQAQLARVATLAWWLKKRFGSPASPPSPPAKRE